MPDEQDRIADHEEPADANTGKPAATTADGADTAGAVDTDGAAGATDVAGAVGAVDTAGAVGAADSDAAGAAASGAGRDEPNAAAESGAKPAAAGTEPAAGAKPAGGSRGRDLRRVGAALAALLLVASLAAAVFFFVQYRKLKDDDSQGVLVAQQSAREAACAYIVDLVNYDFGNLDPFFTKAKDGATGDWKEMITDAEPEMRKNFTDKQVKGQGGTPECGVKSGDEHKASIVTYVTQQLSATDTQGQLTPGPPIYVVMDMENVDGRWLVAKFNAPFIGP